MPDNRPFGYVGIDPGVTGCISILTSDKKYYLHDYKDLEDAGRVLRIWLEQYQLSVALELVFSAGSKKKKGKEQKGHVGNFKIARAMGQFEGIFVGLGIPFYKSGTKRQGRVSMVVPQTWKKGLMKPPRIDPRDKATKALEAVKLFLPGSVKDIYLKKHNGRADAILIAFWLRREIELERRIITRGL